MFLLTYFHFFYVHLLLNDDKKKIFFSFLMMAITIDKLVLDAKRISNRLNDKLVLGDSLISEIEIVNEQLKTLRSVSVVRQFCF